MDGDLDIPEAMERELAQRASPALSDGTTLGDLIDFERRQVAPRMLEDREIHRLEMQRVFRRAWQIVGHVSEIPQADDFVQRQIGQHRVLVTRDRAGQVNVLLNACSHRGLELCWAEKGHQAEFTCPYHGWVFSLDGQLLGTTYEPATGDWDRSPYALRSARVTVRAGVILASFGEDAVGDCGQALDPVLGEARMEALAAPTTDLAAVNWKAAFDDPLLEAGPFPGDVGISTPADPSRATRAALITVVLPQGPLAHAIWRLPLVATDASEAERAQLTAGFASAPAPTPALQPWRSWLRWYDLMTR